jgi:hypothetical protein
MRIGRPRYRRDPALRRRLVLALAGAEERLLCTHGEVAAAFVREVAHALPLETALGIYTRLLGVPAGDSRAVAVRALARLAETPAAADLVVPSVPHDDSPLRRLARRLGGRRDLAVRARIQRAAEQARRALRDVYLAGAADVIAALHGAAGPAEAVQVYIDALRIPPGWAEVIFHAALGGEEPAAA